MIRCKSCRKEVPDGCSYCMFCGEPVGKKAEPIIQAAAKKPTEPFIQAAAKKPTEPFIHAAAKKPSEPFIQASAKTSVKSYPQTDVKKKGRKAVLTVFLILLIFSLLGVGTGLCGGIMNKAREYYANGEYDRAYALTKYFRMLPIHSDELDRYEAAAEVGYYYEYATMLEKNHMEDPSSEEKLEYKDAYQFAAMDLVFGLYLTTDFLKDDTVSDAKRQEYRRFKELYESTLLKMFGMSPEEAKLLTEDLDGKSYDDMVSMVNAWLETHFFRQSFR